MNDQSSQSEYALPLAYLDWVNGFVGSGSTGKLMLVGPDLYAAMTGKFIPKNWRKGKGNAHQRKVRRRWFERNWLRLEKLTRFFFPDA